MEDCLCNEPTYLPISSVAEILYCPRNFYYRVVEAAGDINAHVLEGRLQEEKRNRRSIIKREYGSQVRSIKVASESLNLIGVIDCLEEKNGYYPVEYKKGVIKESLNDDVQLCAQAMVLEEKLSCSIDKGYIYYMESRNRREVYFHDDLRNLVINTVKKALSIIGSGEIPIPVADNRCNGCALENRCLPFETGYLNSTGQKPSRPVPGVNLGRILYVDEQGAKIKKKGMRLLVEKENQLLVEMPLCNIDQAVIIGGVNISTPAMKLLLENGIRVAYLSTTGQFRGVVEPPQSRNILLRQAQFSALFNENKKLEIARSFVVGKLANMRTMLARYNRRVKNEIIEAAIKNINTKPAEGAKNINHLLGIEGFASREYFRALSLLIKPAFDFDFNGRNRRPPRDPVNALLSYAYTLLAKDVHSAVQVVGFDPYAGFLHRPVYGRPALALDLMEEFRPLVADSTVLSAVNRGVFTENDFDYSATGGCFLNNQGRKKLYRCYEERRRQEITHPLFGYRLTYLRLFELQARFLGKVLQGELESYTPFVVR